MTQVLDLIDTDLNQQTDSNDNNELAHYAEAASVTEGYVMGTPVQALCGKIFIPSKNPERLKICPICKEIVEEVSFF
jgi:hypothetical protein